MAQMADMVLTSGNNAAKTFKASNTGTDIARWEERSSSQYIGFERFTLQTRRPQTLQIPQSTRGKGKRVKGGYPTTPAINYGRNVKTLLKIEVPVLEALGFAFTGYSAVPAVAYRMVVDVTFNSPERSSEADKRNILAYLISGLSNTQIQNAVISHDMPRG